MIYSLLIVGAVVVGAIIAYFSAKATNERFTDLAKFVTAILGSFIGLFAAFLLNTSKSNEDKKKHTEQVLNYYAVQLGMFQTNLGMLDSIQAHQGDSESYKVYTENRHTLFQYPYFTDIHDQALYDVTPGSFVEIAHMDNNAKTTYDMSGVPSYQFIISSLKIEAFITRLQLEAEYRYQTQNIDTASQHVTNDSIADVFAKAYHLK